MLCLLWMLVSMLSICVWIEMLRVVMDLLRMSMCGLVVSVWVMVMCCCLLFDSWVG